MRVTIIIPTYNEKDNIGRTIDGLEQVFKAIPSTHQMEILVIDDNSPDGTADIVKAKAAHYHNVKLLPNSKKQGLGAAYIKAMKYAMGELNSDAVFEYDADGSHQPKYIPAMVELLAAKADVVIGSRYIPGGGMPANWGIHRKFLSYFGNLICRVVLFTPQYKDMTTGFRGTKTKFLKLIDLDNLISKQFAYKIQLYYELHRVGARIVEYPIDFVDRSQGRSKFPRNNIIDSLRVVFSLRLRDSRKFIQVAVVGFIGSIVQFIIFNLLRLSFSPEYANVFAVEAAVISNFSLNNLWTFKANRIPVKQAKKLIIKFLQFNLASMGSIIIQFLVLKIGVNLLGRSFLIENSLVAVGILLGLVWNYLMYTRWIWKKK